MPHGESFSAFTITSATTASRITMIASTAISAIIPPRLLTSSRAICPSDLPSRRIEQNRIVKSCTQPPSAAPTISQSVPGKIAELRGERWPDERAGPGDRGEMVAEEHPFVSGNEIAAVFEPLCGGGACVVERENFCGDERGVKAIRDEIGAESRDDEPDGVERLAALECDCGERAGTRERDAGPQNAEQLFH